MKEYRSALAHSLLRTHRLDLLPLTTEQLKTLLENPPFLGKIIIAQNIIDANVIRAIGMKLEKMKTLPSKGHLWQTYWLLIIRAEGIGAGLLGFKSPPNERKQAEIGYGIAASYQNKGYMTEAVHALINWAFENPLCEGITATAVKTPASNRLLEKLGAQIIDQNEEGTSWIIGKQNLNTIL